VPVLLISRGPENALMPAPGLCYVGQIDSLGGAVKMLDTWLPNVVI